MQTHWIALYINRYKENISYNATYFHSIYSLLQKKIAKFTGNKNTITNLYRIQENNWIMCKYFCTGFIDFLLKGKRLLDFTDSFSPKEYEKVIK